MKSEIEVGNALSSGVKVSSNRPRRGFLRRTFLTPLLCSLLAGLGVFGGISALFAGLICVAIHLILIPESIFDRVGTVLLIIAIPMILVGSIFLDEIDMKK